MKTYILASKNAHKAKEIKDILGDDFHIMTQTEAGAGDIEVVEDGKTFEENAIKKAQAIMQATGKPTIADDSGLCVDALGGAPGIYSARYSGEHGNDAANRAKLLKELAGKDDRSAKFVCAVALYKTDGEVIKGLGETHGKIALKEEGTNGFGYDTLFISDDLGKSFGVATSGEKNSISHRKRALIDLLNHL